MSNKELDPRALIFQKAILSDLLPCAVKFSVERADCEFPQKGVIFPEHTLSVFCPVIFQNSTSLTFIKHITQRGFDDAMPSAGLNGTVAIPKFSSRFY